MPGNQKKPKNQQINYKIDIDKWKILCYNTIGNQNNGGDPMNGKSCLVRYITSGGTHLNTAIILIFRPCKIGDYIPIRTGLYAKVLQIIEGGKSNA